MFLKVSTCSVSDTLFTSFLSDYLFLEEQHKDGVQNLSEAGAFNRDSDIFAAIAGFGTCT